MDHCLAITDHDGQAVNIGIILNRPFSTILCPTYANALSTLLFVLSIYSVFSEQPVLFAEKYDWNIAEPPNIRTFYP